MKMLSRICLLLLVASFAIARPSSAADYGTKEQAVAMVEKAISYMKANGKEKTIAAINSHDPQFIDRDLYVVIYDMNGKNVAHGGNPRMVGKNLIDIKDKDGKYFMRERIEIARSKEKGWQEYWFVNQVSTRIEKKIMYVEKADNLIFGCGIYRQ